MRECTVDTRVLARLAGRVRAQRGEFAVEGLGVLAVLEDKVCAFVNDGTGSNEADETSATPEFNDGLASNEALRATDDISAEDLRGDRPDRSVLSSAKTRRHEKK